MTEPEAMESCDGGGMLAKMRIGQLESVETKREDRLSAEDSLEECPVRS